MKNNIAIIGAGSFGTAVAIHLAQKYKVFLWDRNADNIKDMLATRKNNRYLPDVILSSNIVPSSSLELCVEKSDLIIIAVPSHAFVEILNKVDASKGIAWLTKGIDPVTNMFFSDIFKKKYGNNKYAIISGPSFAKEIASSKPTAIVVAGEDLKYMHYIQNIMHFNNIRAYICDDPIGVQLCGAVKNVLAIATGISDALNYGANSRAAIITRGLAELCRLGTALNAKEDTFMGLAGIGDLVLTCTDNLSRNRRFGLLIGQGLDAENAQKNIGQVVEGIWNVEQVNILAKNYNIDMPICNIIQEVLNNNLTPENAAIKLMQRPKNNKP